MANTEFGYVRNFELADNIAPSNWIVVRIDGRGFSKLCKNYHFTKPNDRRALELMNAAAVEVVKSFVDIVLAYGQSDEYSFVFHENTTLFERRREKLATSVSTMFTAEYCMLWPNFMVREEGDSRFVEKGRVIGLERPWPTFDGRCVAYPKKRILRDYLKWRQADCHINNLYNTTFWNVVQNGPMSGTDAELELKGTLAKDKNEILWSRFGVNYNAEPEIYKKGSVVYRDYGECEATGGNGGWGGNKEATEGSRSQMEREKKRKQKARIVVEHVDIIQDTFWEKRPWILATKKGEEE
ncbi:tRNA(His) guanylyltransferase [Fulvia fulva]|uniref:tRNA(His) guanylyltransferase n=1 Tax=Passalora fulva TaxID=5499 RepID=A0A9Q8LFI9_PASFU|nr:tRNA(His) guanylyltransferase [Fulvia fulva]KAK4626417.1 tRNA(His) guanylyltransferase [Fulvia fulva]KAK4628499.1 tRNA(His) guanylyltransferase [Fulvia fulva]UJO16465.1 tRNA(His) guanylyltransferase [Fulvia fulva]WPV13528.1 tRNA(His) guanylyltransferase [Fulvia fulva]WPV28187.1 tRNA(His) guanylyltransferase [Fulvia fulva]